MKSRSKRRMSADLICWIAGIKVKWFTGKEG